jgi:hypothetical protein
MRLQLLALVWQLASITAQPTVQSRIHLDSYAGLSLHSSPVSAAYLPPCDLAVVLASRQTLNTVAKAAEDWIKQQDVCHFHLVVPISNVTLHYAEMEVYFAILAQRPRTTLLVFDHYADYQVERNAAMVVSQRRHACMHNACSLLSFNVCLRS